MLVCNTWPLNLANTNELQALFSLQTLAIYKRILKIKLCRELTVPCKAL